MICYEIPDEALRRMRPYQADPNLVWFLCFLAQPRFVFSMPSTVSGNVIVFLVQSSHLHQFLWSSRSSIQRSRSCAFCGSTMTCSHSHNSVAQTIPLRTQSCHTLGDPRLMKSPFKTWKTVARETSTPIKRSDSAENRQPMTISNTSG
jgi:hypothetical protein